VNLPHFAASRKSLNGSLRLNVLGALHSETGFSLNANNGYAQYLHPVYANG
jgi:hypothetical protein